MGLVCYSGFAAEDAELPCTGFAFDARCVRHADVQ